MNNESSEPLQRDAWEYAKSPGLPKEAAVLIRKLCLRIGELRQERKERQDRAAEMRKEALIRSGYLQLIGKVPNMEFACAEKDKWCSPCNQIGLGSEGPTIQIGSRYAFLSTRDGKQVSFCLDCFNRIFGEEGE